MILSLFFHIVFVGLFDGPGITFWGSWTCKISQNEREGGQKTRNSCFLSVHPKWNEKVRQMTPLGLPKRTQIIPNYPKGVPEGRFSTPNCPKRTPREAILGPEMVSAGPLGTQNGRFYTFGVFFVFSIEPKVV